MKQLQAVADAATVHKIRIKGLISVIACRNKAFYFDI